MVLPRSTIPGGGGRRILSLDSSVGGETGQGASRQETAFDAGGHIAGLLESVSPASPPDPRASTPLRSAIAQEPHLNLTRLYQTLSPGQRQSVESAFGSGTLRSLLSLAEETDPEIFYSDLMSLGQDLRRQGKRSEAGLIFASVAQSEQAPAVFSERAQTQLEILSGGGSVGDQLELASETFVEEAADPIMLASMLGAQATFGMSRLALMRTLPRGFAGGLPWVRTLTANGVAFGLEGLSFVGTHHGLAHLAGRPTTPGLSLTQELGHTYLTLGLLKGFGFLSQSALAARAAAPGRSLAHTLLPQLAMYGGIFSSNALAPHLGLGEEMSLGRNLLTSGITLMHFNAAGALMNGIPGYGRANQWMHEQTQLATRDAAHSGARQWQLLSEWMQNGLQPDLATVGGIRLPAESLGGEREAPIYMMSMDKAPGSESSISPPSSGGSPETIRPPTSEPPSGSSGSGSIPPIDVKSSLPWWGRRLIGTAEGLGRLDLNRLQTPHEGPRPVRRAVLPSPVESMEHGLLLSMAEGQGHRQVAHTRMVLDQTRAMPETRELYLDLEGNRMEFQRGLREKLDPILQRLRLPEMGELSQAITDYEGAVRQALGEGVPVFEADAILNLYNAKQMADPVFRETLSEEQLIRMGYEPRAVRWAGEHVDDFWPGAIEQIVLGNSILRASPHAEKVIEAAREFDPNHEQPRQALRGALRLKKALRTFLDDPSLAHVWLSEVALHHSAREMMRRNPRGFLREVLAEAESHGADFESMDQIPEFAGRMNQWLHAYQNLQGMRASFSGTGRFSGIRSLFDGAARLFGYRDFRPLHQAQGAYERATQDLLTHHETELIPSALRVLQSRYERLNPQQRQTLSLVRSNVMHRWAQMTDSTRANLSELEPEISDFIAYHDRGLVPLREQGLRVGMSHVSELFDTLRSQMGEAAFDREVAPQVREIHDQFERLVRGLPGEDKGQPIDPENKAIIGYLPATERGIRGDMNPRDFNRNIEAPLRVIMNGYKLAFKTARANGVNLGSVRRIIPMFESYAFKADLPGLMSTRERYSFIAQYALHALPKILRLDSVQNHGYPFSEGGRLFQDFGANLGHKTNPQTFHVPEGIEPVVDYFGTSISGDHNTHLDFIGNADNIVAAMLGVRARPESIPDIIAKFDLAIPVIDKVFPYLTNLIGNQPHELAASARRATQMQALGGLEHGRMSPTRPLGYDNITMDVTNGEGPYNRDPASPVTGSLPVMGRFFDIAEGASAITGRPQAMAFIQDPGALRNYPSQRGKPALLRNPNTMAVALFPQGALPEGNGGKITPRNNIERLIWYLQAYHPQLDPQAPFTDRFYQDFAKPLDPHTEAIAARLFQGAQELYPTVEGIRSLEARRRELGSLLDRETRAESEQTDQVARDLGLVNRALDQQTRQLLRNQLSLLDQRLTAEVTRIDLLKQYPGLRRMQRILRSRMKLLASVESKVAKGEAFSLTERRFVERAGAALAGRDVTSGRDRVLEQLDFFFRCRDEGKTVQEGFEELQRRYHGFITQWNERRRDPTTPEHSQLHISEAEGFLDLKRQYTIAVEAQYNLAGITPTRWEGEIFPDMVFRREGGRTVIEPLGWQASREFSRGRLWQYLIDDTMFGLVPLARNAPRFDATPTLYLDLHQAWGYRTLARTQTRLSLENTDQLREVGNVQSIVAPTHDSGAEFATIPAVMLDYGLNAFFMADRKFFDASFFRPPAFGLIRRLLGPMESYGHFSIDRADRRAALNSMKSAGRFVSGQPYEVAGERHEHEPRSIIIFPGGTRNPVRYTQSGERVEGPIYGTRPGVGLSFAGANQSDVRVPVVPIGLVNGGVMYPKQTMDAMITGGAALGRTYHFRFGQPLWYDTLVPGTPRPRETQVRSAIVENLDRQFSELTGREVGPPAQSKAKKKK